MNKNIVTICLVLASFALAFSSSAEMIAQQNFESDIFKSISEGAASNGAESGDTYFNRTNNSPVSHLSTGVMDIGFIHDGKISTTQGGVAGVVAGKLKLSHYSSTYSGSDLYNQNPQFFGSNPRNADLIFDEVNLDGYANKTFSIDLEDFGNLGDDDDLYIRLRINGVDVTIFDTRGGATGHPDASSAKNGATYSGTTLSYNFQNTDATAQLIIDVLLDDAGQGYSFDNIKFEGTLIPIITSQTFDADIFKSISEGSASNGAESGDTYFNRTNNASVSHISTGLLDLGFTHDGKISTSQGGTAGVVAGKLHLIHYSSTYSGSDLYNEDHQFFDSNPRNADLIFDEVNLAGYMNKTFSIDLAGLGTPGDDDDLYIRLKINGTYVNIFDTRSGADGVLDPSDARGGAVFDGTTLTYNLPNSANTVQVFIDVLADDATDGYSFDNIIFRGISNPDTPVFDSSPMSRPDAFALMSYAQTISGSAIDPNGDPLTYTKVNGPEWLSVAPDGTLSGSPSFSDVGTNTFQVMVSDGNGGSDVASLNIEVKESSQNPGAPSFSSDPLQMPAGRATVVYTGTLANLASDPSNDPLTFAKVSGPAWLNISPDGSLNGTPTDTESDKGANIFEVSVTDSKDGAHKVQMLIQINNPDGSTYHKPSNTEHYRLIWANDPSTTLTVAWKQISGQSGVVYYGKEDFGRDYENYPNQKSVDRTGQFVSSGTINTCFAHLTGLQPDSIYYFVIKDDVGVSPRYWFVTAPDKPKPFTFIAGGDSRTYRTPRRKANRMVAKLRPLFVVFTGDMISSSNANSWDAWFEDWQETISPDGRMYPLIPHRGNHEGYHASNNNAFYQLFDTSENNYYSFSVGGDLFRFYVLNSEMHDNATLWAAQNTWLENDLTSNAANHRHLAAGYHKPMRPHVSGKSEGYYEYNAWSQLFYDYGVNIAFEADSHTTKRTYPIKPFTGVGSDEGFIRDDSNADGDNKNGTVFSGEGCWGAPLRDPDDTKDWTMAAGKFNSFDWLHVYPSYMELYTIKVDNEANVGFLQEGDVFSFPSNIDIWNPASGARLVINNQNATTELSYSQWQLDQWGIGTIPANSRALDDFDGDGINNMTEFSFGLNPKVRDAISKNAFPVMSVQGGVSTLSYRRAINTTLHYVYEYSNDLITWNVLTEGESADFTQTITPDSDGENEHVTIQLRGDKAAALKIFIRVRIEN